MPFTKDKFLVRENPQLVAWERETRKFLRQLSPEHGHRVAAVMVYDRPDGRKIICLWRRGVVIYNNDTRLMVSPAPAAQNVTVTFSAARKVDTFKPHSSSDPITSLSSASTTSVTVPLVAEGAMLVVGPTGSTPPDPVDQTPTATFTVGGSSVSATYTVTP